MKIILDVIENTGITATAGIGTNLYLCKVAMDILAKHIPADENGVRIAELDEMTYRQTMWSHQPLTAVPSKRLRHIIPVKTALVPVRFCIARIPQKGLGWC